MAPAVTRGDPTRLRKHDVVSPCPHAFTEACWRWSRSVAGRRRIGGRFTTRRSGPVEKKIIWYRLSAKLPEIAPADAAEDPRPLRARVKSPQTMVAGIKDEEKPAPMIWTPEPAGPRAPKPVALPNVIAVAPARVLRPFVPPPEMSSPRPPPNSPTHRVSTRAAAQSRPDRGVGLQACAARLRAAARRAHGSPGRAPPARSARGARHGRGAQCPAVDARDFTPAPARLRSADEEGRPQRSRRTARSPGCGARSLRKTPRRCRKGSIVPPRRPEDRTAPGVPPTLPRSAPLRLRPRRPRWPSSG